MKKRPIFILSIVFLILTFLQASAYALPPSVELISTDYFTLTSGETKQVVLTVRNYEDVVDVVDIHLSSNSELNNWIWFSNHRYDSKRHDLSVVMQPYDLKRIVINIFGGNSGTYITDGVQANGLNINAVGMSGFGATNISVSVKPVPQGLFKRQAPGITFIHILFIGFIGSLVFLKPIKI
ncbi:MAG: hypothetical protein K0B02_03905 [DPANN group archaeon]|nr:hypothetical protein [DPANN group archaeon]